MPLHLLGKKSWNVYNADNIARVKRDEAAEASRLEAEQRRMQEVSGEKRIEKLRRPHFWINENHDETKSIPSTDGLCRPIKQASRRKRPGEDDTDRDLRVAKELQAFQRENRDIKLIPSNASLLNDGGHIALFPGAPSHNKERNPEALEDETRRLQEIKEPYVMRFSDAAGFRKNPGKDPWYLEDYQSRTQTSSTGFSRDFCIKSKQSDLRKQPKTAAVDDPLSLMRRGIESTKHVNRERRKWKQERRKEFDNPTRAKEQKSSPNLRSRYRQRPPTNEW